MIISKLRASLLVAIIGASPAAFAFHLSVVGVGDFSSKKADPATANYGGTDQTLSGSSKLGIGAGVLVGFSLMPMIEFETGGLYITRKYSVTDTVPLLGQSEVDVYTQHALQIPILIRFHVIPHVSLGAGGYYAMGMGQVQVDSDGVITNAGVAKTTTDTFEARSLKKNDYGLLLSAALRLPLSPMVSFLIDGRYALGLNDVNATPDASTPAVKEKYTDIQVLAGLRFGMM